MDQCTHEVRARHWIGVIQDCQQRPAGISIRQWLKDNHIGEQSYYKWQRKFRQEAFSQMQEVSDSVPEVCKNKVAFAEIPFQQSDRQNQENFQSDYSPAAVIRSSKLTIAITNEISEELLSRIITEVTNA